MDIAGLGTFDLDLATGRFSWSARAAEIYGASSDDLGAWDDWLAHVHPDDRAGNVALKDRIVSDPTLIDGEGAYRFRRPDGEERWVAKRVRIFRAADGRAERVCGVIADETERRNAEQKTVWLTHEMQHRVKTILAVVKSLSRSTLEASVNLEDYGAHFDGRLNALSRVQGMLARRVGEGADLEQIVMEEFVQHLADDGQVEIEGDSVALHGRTAEYVGLAIHELAVNAVKYGALSARNGRVRVAWTVEDDRLLLIWEESGVPAVATNPAREGFGRRLVEEGLPYQLGATTRFGLEPGGLKCSMEIPLANQAAGIA